MALPQGVRQPSNYLLDRSRQCGVASCASMVRAYRKEPMMSRRTPIRHGEVLLFPVPQIPDGRREAVTSCVVGHSESGHHHVLESDRLFAQIMAANGDLYVELDAPTPLRHHKTHQQHRELIVPPGAWRVIKKTEFDLHALPLDASEPPVHVEAVPPPAHPRLRRQVRD